MQSTRDLGRPQPKPCPEQTQPWGLTRYLRAFYPIWADSTQGPDSTPGMEMAQPLLAPPALLGCLHGEKPFSFYQAEHLLLQSMAIVFHSPALCSEEKLLYNFLTDIVRKAQ